MRAAQGAVVDHGRWPRGHPKLLTVLLRLLTPVLERTVSAEEVCEAFPLLVCLPAVTAAKKGRNNATTATPPPAMAAVMPANAKALVDANY